MFLWGVRKPENQWETSHKKYPKLRIELWTMEMFYRTTHVDLMYNLEFYFPLLQPYNVYNDAVMCIYIGTIFR